MDGFLLIFLVEYHFNLHEAATFEYLFTISVLRLASTMEAPRCLETSQQPVNTTWISEWTILIGIVSPGHYSGPSFSSVSC